MPQGNRGVCSESPPTPPASTRDEHRDPAPATSTEAPFIIVADVALSEGIVFVLVRAEPRDAVATMRPEGGADGGIRLGHGLQGGAGLSSSFR